MTPDDEIEKAVDTAVNTPTAAPNPAVTVTDTGTNWDEDTGTSSVPSLLVAPVETNSETSGATVSGGFAAETAEATAVAPSDAPVPMTPSSAVVGAGDGSLATEPDTSLSSAASEPVVADTSVSSSSGISPLSSTTEAPASTDAPTLTGRQHTAVHDIRDALDYAVQRYAAVYGDEALAEYLADQHGLTDYKAICGSSMLDVADFLLREVGE